MHPQPGGVINSLFRFKCLNVSAKRYSDLTKACVCGMVVGIYQSQFNNTVTSISNVVAEAWRIGQPQDIEEERALFFTAGTMYSDPKLVASCYRIVQQVAEKVGIEIMKQEGLKPETISALVLDIITPDEAIELDGLMQLETAGRQEVIGKFANPMEN